MQTSFSPKKLLFYAELLKWRLIMFKSKNQKDQASGGDDTLSEIQGASAARGPIQTSSPKSTKDPSQASNPQKSESDALELEELLARLETSEETKPSILFSKKSLQGVIADLENDIKNNKFTNVDYAHIDLTMMPRLVERENSQNPGLNLQFTMNPDSLIKSIHRTVNNGITSSRFLVGLEGEEPHFAVIDHQTINKKTSLILFDTTRFMNMNAQILGLTMKSAIEDSQLPYCYFSMAEINLQENSSESGILSLVLAKKLYLEADKLKVMHQDNIKGILSKKGTALHYKNVDSYLPGTFYKHSQTGKRLTEYVRENPDYSHKSVNKKDETLHHRLDRHLVMMEDKVVSCSPQKKRIQKYKALVR
ncbi:MULTISPECIES: YopJ/AvrA family T3SS effector serine/threonine acetyltransferase [unclassified Bartonella]|uniref:YopJ/AvrA family T3SS effector serine/threonine acetyltransferase n=1 Tax=unclassified Bartonella TaxID=2645622 RepID=UPI0009C3509B|nr:MULTISPECIES: YopJ/AvrA family T3SS effector serine/threonine acetyltransferase [unclassified Bartonella]AQX28372.1 YopJ protease family [Bartonella sp. JB15]AQX29639.1 YopJ protease family [Bartonella sp. JB63]